MLTLVRRVLLGAVIVTAVLLLTFAGGVVPSASAGISSFSELPPAAQLTIERRMGIAADSGSTSAVYFQRPELTASDGIAGDKFAYGPVISGDGNTIVASSYRKTVNQEFGRGEVYVFVKPASGWDGNMVESARLSASDGATDDWFGYSLAVSRDGSVIVVGAHYHAFGSKLGQGEVYVFVRPPGGWSGSLQETARLAASDGAAYDYLGASVAISADGNTIVAGAIGHKFDSMPQSGAAYVFVKPCNISYCGWVTNTQTGLFYPIDGGTGDYFGWSIAVSADGETVVVGAVNHGFDASGTSRQGAAYVFVNPHIAGGWPAYMTQNGRLWASDRAANDLFGWSVAMSGNGGAIVVSAPYHNVAGHQAQGEAYVLLRGSSGWSGNQQELSKLVASDGAPGDGFGQVAISEDGNRVVVGAPNRSVGGNGYQGEVYVYAPCELNFTWCVPWFFPAEIARLVASDSAGNDLFGYPAISGNGKTVVVGAPLHNVSGRSHQGAAYVFLDLNATYLPMIRR